MSIPFRMGWAAFWWGFFHPFQNDDQKQAAAIRIFWKYAPLVSDSAPEKEE